MLVHAESLDNLIASLRQHTSPLPPIPALPTLRRGDVIEIQGPASSGKTHLLYHIILSLLLPPQDTQIAAVVYDTDASFDIQRFRHLLLSRISRIPSGALDPQACLHQALTRLHLFRPTSLAQLAASIANLPAYHSSRMPNQEIAVLAIDSFSTFYWADRFSTEQLRNIVPPKTPSITTAPPLRHVLDAIQSVRRSLGPLAVLTNWALNSAPSRSEPTYKQHLHPFPILQDAIADLGVKVATDTDHSCSSPFHLAHHITLSSPSSNPFPAVPLHDAHRQRMIGNGQVHALTRSSETRNTARFTLWITDDDVLV